MDVFVGNLPGSATLVELQGFLGDIDLRADFTCNKGHDRHGRPYHYFVARTGNREQGLALIRKLSGRVFEGRPVVVREYIRRTAVADWRAAERRVNSA